MSAVVVATLDRRMCRVHVGGRELVDLVDLAGIPFRTLPTGALIIALDDLGDLEASCAIRRRPVRIQSKRAVDR